jgi:hypothetical protein
MKEVATSVTEVATSVTVVESTTTTKVGVVRTGAPPVLEAMPERVAAPEVIGAVKLFDVVCNIDGVLASSLGFGVADKMAREHNDDNPGHDADTVLRQQ